MPGEGESFTHYLIRSVRETAQSQARTVQNVGVQVGESLERVPDKSSSILHDSLNFVRQYPIPGFVSVVGAFVAPVIYSGRIALYRNAIFGIALGASLFYPKVALTTAESISALSHHLSTQSYRLRDNENVPNNPPGQ
eukprot:CAMPEP_0184649808 /NCGR_PEP_ID=MMETSP0308-20130426/7237_1 /TAXON_ID=38269 /ORGANISM="Gloeochaete witrockiana, Strain SAG 46.84" /LENGTH=137 /DNA_ID=CAMNT_0027082827 /DNA_START=26 /DNA_END=439 /DNA_ORIENTATION=+